MGKSAFVQSVSYDEWEGVSDRGASIDKPDWETVEELIRNLNQTKYSVVTLQIEGDYGLNIGGGNGHYIVDALLDSASAVVAINSQSVDENVIVTIGGQSADFSTRYILDFNQVLLITKHFFRTGKLLDDFEWEREY